MTLNERTNCYVKLKAAGLMPWLLAIFAVYVVGGWLNIAIKIAEAFR